MPELKGSFRAKFERAKLHVYALQAEALALEQLKRSPLYTLEAKTERQPTEVARTLYYVHSVFSFPETWSLIIGGCSVRFSFGSGSPRVVPRQHSRSYARV
jgi:hypothetical protein